MINYTHIIVGGGAYGCYLALKLIELIPQVKVLIVEKEKDLLLRASYNNQARVHNGYHYPRSLLTGLRSRINFSRFIKEFPDCVVSDFDKIYGIANKRSKVTASQFYQFCQRINAPIKPAPESIRKLFNQDLIEDIFLVKEYAFNANKLREIFISRLAKAKIDILKNTEAKKVILNQKSSMENQMYLQVEDHESGEIQELSCQYIYNCAYSELNKLIVNSNLEKLFLRHEATEMALIQVPDYLKNLGITVMCGPFFSVMPFPAKSLFSFSHVSYTPHYEWSEIPSAEKFKQHYPQFPLKSNFNYMLKDAIRYLPALADCSYVDSIWEVKTILPQSDYNDSRPILFKRDASATNFISVLGGKIDNIFELDEAIIKEILTQ